MRQTWLTWVRAKNKPMGTELCYLKPTFQTSKGFCQAYYFRALNKANFIKSWQFKWVLILGNVLRILQVHDYLYFWIIKKFLWKYFHDLLRQREMKHKSGELKPFLPERACRRHKWLWHGPFVFHLPRRFRFASLFLAVEKSNSPWIPSYKREADLARSLGTVPLWQLEEMWIYSHGLSPLPAPHCHLALERKWKREDKCLFPSEILNLLKKKSSILVAGTDIFVNLSRFCPEQSHTSKTQICAHTILGSTLTEGSLKKKKKSPNSFWWSQNSTIYITEWNEIETFSF